MSEVKPGTFRQPPPTKQGADPRIIAALKTQRAELKARVDLMPKGSDQRYQGEALLRDHDAQIARVESI